MTNRLHIALVLPIVAGFSCSDPGNLPIRTVSIEKLVAESADYDGRHISVNGFLLAKDLPNGDQQFYLAPDGSWADMVFSTEELNNLAVRLSFPAEPIMPLPNQCTGFFVVAQGKLHSVRGNAVLSVADHNGIWSRERNNRIDCRYEIGQ